MNLFHKIREVVAALECPKKFTLKDLIKPDSDRTELFLTGATKDQPPDNHRRHHRASRVIGTGTLGCGSTIVEGEDFIAENITIENSAPKGSGQAMAIRVTADRSAFYNCRFLGWQASSNQGLI
ncbi:unnamed protein product [Ilex paraguariensis]|uniref:pectinesterase n=1 Tax=Ilex paraguariensis TaxID=185542 RepID=A0ABC8R587_9AQUA